jgi:hypothetical protein
MPKYSACDLLEIRQEDRPFQIKMVERTPIKSVIKRYTPMSNSPGGKAAHISEETGFYMVGPQESVIFYTKSPRELDILVLY